MTTYAEIRAAMERLEPIAKEVREVAILAYAKELYERALLYLPPDVDHEAVRNFALQTAWLEMMRPWGAVQPWGLERAQREED